MRLCTILLAALTLALLAPAVPASAYEIIDGDNELTVRNNMHTCPWGFIVSGVHVNNNDLLCTGYFGWSMGSEVVRNLQLFIGHRRFVRCAHNEFVTGIHVANRTLSCSKFTGSATDTYDPNLGSLFIDEGAGLTVRANMHACPTDSVLVGADWDTNSFLCAELNHCYDDSQCGGLNCEKSRILGGPLYSLYGVCRDTGYIQMREGNSCTQDAVGTLTDRPGTTAVLTNIGWIPNDEARSVQLSNVRPGAVIRFFDNSGGSTSDDWTEIRVHSRTPNNYCIPTFEASYSTNFVTVTHHHHNGIDGKISRVQVVQ